VVPKIVHTLGITKNDKRNPVIFIGPMNHHSNILPWREIGCKIVNIPLNEEGLTDISFLEKELKKYQKDSQLLIGTFSACSNVTGILSSIDDITILLHKHNCLAIWDYAACA
jgi:selenocysteine lyase/cysteine desulfurase